MLQSIREKTSGWIASLMLGLIIVIMTAFGMLDYLKPTVENYAAKIESAPKFWVFGRETRDISNEEFRRRFQNAREQARSEQGEAFDAAAFETPENKRAILEELIDETVLEMAASDAGVSISKLQLQREIAKIPAFQTDGKFDKDKYVAALQARGQSPDEFVQLVRTGLVQQAVPQQIAYSAVFGDAELDAYIRMAQQARHARILEIPPPTEPPAPPSDADIKAWFDAHAATYRSPEQVTVDYLELDADALPPPAPADDAALHERYEQQKLRFGTPEQRIAAHILVQVAADAPAAAWAAAEAKAKEIAAKAQAPGADFAALAKQYSDDISTKDSGGELGALEQDASGQDDAYAPIKAAVYGLAQPGMVSAPVRSTYGWHVVQYRGLLPGSTKPFEAVRDQIAAEYLQAERERAYSDAVGELSQAVYATPASIQAVAQKAGVKVQRSTPFTRDRGEGVSTLAPVRKAAFAEDQLAQRQVSDPIEVSPTHVVVLQVVDHQAEAAQTLAQVHDKVVADLMADRAEKAVKAHAEALLARAQKGEALDAIATGLGRTVMDVPKMSRQSPSPQLAPVVDAVFELPRPAAGKESIGLAKAKTGEYVLVGVLSVEDGDPASIDAETRKTLRENIAKARGAQEAKDYTAALRKRYRISVNEANL